MKPQKTVIVTGASQGIGAELVHTFIDRGYNVVATSRSASKAGFSPLPRLAVVDGDVGDSKAAADVVRLPGRVDPAVTRFVSTVDLAGALRRAETAHGEHEKRIGHADPYWPDWYAEYIVREQSGEELPQ